MKKLLLLIATLLISSTAQASALSNCAEQIKYGPPSQSGVILCRQGYVLSYNTARKTANWIAYHLTRQDMHGNIPRTNDFRPDPDLTANQQAQLTDYKHTHYVHGQLVPAASMRWGARAMSESFLMSATAPFSKQMYDGIWSTLAKKVRDWVNSRGELYVVTGNIYDSPKTKRIGPDSVSVPSAFFKVIFDPVRVEAIAFIIPNHRENASALPRFITSVEQVEQVTGLSFFPKLNDSVKLLVKARAPFFWTR